MAAVDKTYGDALFSLVTEEDEKALPTFSDSLKAFRRYLPPSRTL